MLRKFCYFLITALTLILILTFFPIGSEDPNPEMEIYLLSNPIHTDIAIPVRNEVFDWESFLNPLDFKSRPADWIEIGWGDRQFYFEMPTWDKFTFKLGFDALFIPDPAILHVNYLDAHPTSYSGHRRIRISKATYKKLVEEIRSQFQLKNGRPILIPNKGYSDTDNFYESFGSFSILKTCNVWTAQRLGAVGIKRPLWSPTKYGLEFIWSN
ncbi:TIGR02117 family protein [Peredibacter sp. HCB2-198]|uniref:TIGR02117 family protein n=1 Tax=Peredibacter sp. HCB2-198 TaxID=3383025 RepID=UPI0038B5A832